MVQGELFREEAGSSDLYAFNQKAKRSFLSSTRVTVTLDKLLLASLAVLAVFVLAFSFGVEHGKRAMEKRLESLFPTQFETLPRETGLRDPIETSEEETVLVIDQKVPTSTSVGALPPGVPRPSIAHKSLPLPDPVKQGKYTVQLVTYGKETLAAREVVLLKSKGHESFVIPSGNFFQVCANYFDTQSRARTVLSRFRAEGRYPDAFVRPVVR